MSTLIPLMVAVPLMGAAFVLGFNSLGWHIPVRVLTLSVILFQTVIAVVLFARLKASGAVYWFGGWTPRSGLAIGVSFTVDRVGAGLAVLACLATAAAMTCTESVRESVGIVHALLLTLLAAMVGFCLSGDLFNMFVFFELMAVSAFALVAYATEDLGSLRSALNFAITNSIGAFLVLIGIALLYSRTGALNLAQMGRAVGAGQVPGRVLAIALAVIVVGFLIKAAVVPFHFWLVDTVASAPTALVVILAGVLDSLGIYGVARVYWTVFGQWTVEHHALQMILVSVGALSAACGAVLSLTFQGIWRRLAFIMVAHTGITLIGVGCLSSVGMAGAALYAISDGAVKIALVLGIVVLAGGASSARRRIGRVVVALAGLALAGLPLFGTGVAKPIIEDAVNRAGYPWAAVVIVVAAAVTGAAALEIGWRRAQDAAAGSGAREGRSWLQVAGAATVMLGMAAAASWALPGTAAAAARFVDSGSYQQRVLGGSALVRPVPVPRLHPGSTGIALDLVAVGAAVGLAGLLTHRPEWLPARSPIVGRLRAVARRAHDGSIGDSATWVTIGTATIAVILATAPR